MSVVKIPTDKLEISFEGFEDSKYDPFELAAGIEKLKPVDGDSMAQVRQFRDEVLKLPTMTLSQAMSALAGVMSWLDDAKKNIEWMRKLQALTEAAQTKA